MKFGKTQNRKELNIFIFGGRFWPILGSPSGHDTMHSFEKISKSSEQEFRRNKIGKAWRNRENGHGTMHIFFPRGGNLQILRTLVYPNCATVQCIALIQIWRQPYPNLPFPLKSTHSFFATYRSRDGIRTAELLYLSIYLLSLSLSLSPLSLSLSLAIYFQSDLLLE